MSLKESIYTLPAAESQEARAQQYGEFIENVLGITNKEEASIIDSYNVIPYWLDKDKTCGIAVVYTTLSSSYTGVRIVPISPKNKFSHESLPSNYGKEENIYYQTSKSGSVIYLRTAINSYRMIFAKDESDCWSGFFDDVMYYKDGEIDITNGTPTNSSTFFSAVKMPSIVYEKMFKELYKVLGATVFAESNTIVNFNGQLYKVVSVIKGTSKIYPCFAFPIAD